MKSRVFLLSAFLFVLTMFHPVQAKADGFWDWINEILGGKGSGSNTGSGSGTGSTSTNLPINGDVVYLMVAGIAIGITVVSKKRSEKTAVNV